MAPVRDSVCLPRADRPGLCSHRLANVWPGGGRENVGRRNTFPQARTVGEPVSGASVRQQVSIGMASVVQIPLTDAHRSIRSRLAGTRSLATLDPKTRVADAGNFP